MRRDGYKTYSEAQIRNMLGSGVGGSGVSREPVFQSFTSLTEITVNHNFGTKYVTVTVYTTSGYIIDQGKIKAIQCSDTSVRIAFISAQSGLVKLTY
jgi:hypothetical protein